MGRRVRHEAGEALGAIGKPECLAPLLQHADDSVLEVCACQGLPHIMNHNTTITIAGYSYVLSLHLACTTACCI